MKKENIFFPLILVVPCFPLFSMEQHPVLTYHASTGASKIIEDAKEFGEQIAAVFDKVKEALAHPEKIEATIEYLKTRRLKAEKNIQQWLDTQIKHLEDKLKMQTPTDLSRTVCLEKEFIKAAKDLAEAEKLAGQQKTKADYLKEAYKKKIEEKKDLINQDKEKIALREQEQQQKIDQCERALEKAKQEAQQTLTQTNQEKAALDHQEKLYCNQITKIENYNPNSQEQLPITDTVPLITIEQTRSLNVAKDNKSESCLVQ